MSEQNPVVVRVKGSFRDAEGREDEILTVTRGRHYFHRDKHYVLYDDESLQQGEKTPTILKIGRDAMTLLRRGTVEQEQRFECGAEKCSMYRTPYGNINLAVRTEELVIHYDEGETAGMVDIRYDLFVNGAFQSSNMLHIEIEEDHGGGKRLCVDAP